MAVDAKCLYAPHLYKKRMMLTADAVPTIFAHVNKPKERESSIGRSQKRQKTEVILFNFAGVFGPTVTVFCSDLGLAPSLARVARWCLNTGYQVAIQFSVWKPIRLL